MKNYPAELVVSCVEEPKNYAKQIRSYMLFLGFPLLAEILGLVFFTSAAVPGTFYFWMVVVFEIGAIVSAFRCVPPIQKERDLYLKTKGRELILTGEELRVSIGLVEDFGIVLSGMRERGDTYLAIPWKEITQFGVERILRSHPVRYARVYTVKAGAAGSFSMFRAHFSMSEAHLLKEFRKHLAINMDIKDGPDLKSLKLPPDPGPGMGD